MASPYRQKVRGIRKSSLVITVAANATPEVIWNLTQGGQNPRTAIIRKIMAYNDVGAITLEFAVAGVNILPVLRLLNNIDNEWLEDEIPEVEVGGDITVETDLLGVQVQLEIEEVGS